MVDNKMVEVPESLLREFFAALDRVHEMEQRKTWSGGYVHPMRMGDRINMWQDLHRLRKLIEPPPPPDVDAVHLEKIQSVITDLRAAGMNKTANLIEQAINPTKGT